MPPVICSTSLEIDLLWLRDLYDDATISELIPVPIWYGYKLYSIDRWNLPPLQYLSAKGRLTLEPIKCHGPWTVYFDADRLSIHLHDCIYAIATVHMSTSSFGSRPMDTS
eukprot:scaffold14532_cov133-Skeletonema_menzelii.AAC.4